MTTCNRRRFLQTAAAGAVAAAVRPALAKSSRDPIRCGVIGVGNRGTYLMRLAAQRPDVAIVAVCDIRPEHVSRAQDIIAAADRPRPLAFGDKGHDDYRRLLDRNDLDAVVVTTPMQDHARMSIDALQAGKAVLSEVAAAVTLDECRDLVRTVEETGKFYMMAENVCYYRNCMMILNMVRQGLFGGLTYADCGYIHDCRKLHYHPDGSLTWRGRLARDHIGNTYPTHAIGPVAQWLDINRSDRFVSLVAMDSRQTGITREAIRRFGPDSPQAKQTYKRGDSTTCLLRTANGAYVDIRYDTISSRPHRSTCYFGLQGETAAYRSLTGDIWMDSKSPEYKWENADAYQDKFDHPYWIEHGKEAAATGHGGADFFVIKEFFDALHDGRTSPIDVYDAAVWSAITPLSAQSLAAGSSAVVFPDFTTNRPAPRPS